MSTPDADARAAEIAARWTAPGDILERTRMALARAVFLRTAAGRAETADALHRESDEDAVQIRADVAFLLAERVRLLAESEVKRGASEAPRVRITAPADPMTHPLGTWWDRHVGEVFDVVSVRIGVPSQYECDLTRLHDAGEITETRGSVYFACATLLPPD